MNTFYTSICWLIICANNPVICLEWNLWNWTRFEPQNTEFTLRCYHPQVTVPSGCQNLTYYNNTPRTLYTIISPSHFTGHANRAVRQGQIMVRMWGYGRSARSGCEQIPSCQNSSAAASKRMIYCARSYCTIQEDEYFCITIQCATLVWILDPIIYFKLIKYLSC